MNEAYELDATVFLETFMIFESTNGFKGFCHVKYKTAKLFEINEHFRILLLGKKYSVSVICFVRSELNDRCVGY
jgi:hypothetical protein